MFLVFRKNAKNRQNHGVFEPRLRVHDQGVVGCGGGVAAQSISLETNIVGYNELF